MRRALPLFGLLVTMLVLLPNVTGTAQEAETFAPPAEPTPEATLAPTEAPATPDPTPPPTATPTPYVQPSPLPSPSLAPTPAPLTPAPAPYIPRIARTAPHDTNMLVALLEPLTEWGLPLEQVLVEGMGRFPVAARANYSDDWLAPRYTPSFHLHRGLDIFAETGVPIRAPDAGAVTEFSDSYPGGVGVTFRNYAGRTYYFGHMATRAPDLQVGQSVEMGTVLGYVGDTGNAAGGSPHLHLEIRDGGVAVPPKPIVDGWLEEAEGSAGDFIEARRVQIDLERQFGASLTSPSDLASYQLDLLLGPQGP